MTGPLFGTQDDISGTFIFKSRDKKQFHRNVSEKCGYIHTQNSVRF